MYCVTSSSYSSFSSKPILMNVVAPVTSACCSTTVGTQKNFRAEVQPLPIRCSRTLETSCGSRSPRTRRCSSLSSAPSWGSTMISSSAVSTAVGSSLGPPGSSHCVAALREPRTRTPKTRSRWELVRERNSSPLRPLLPQSCGTSPTSKTPPRRRSWQGYNASSNTPPQTRARGAETSTAAESPDSTSTTSTRSSKRLQPWGMSSGTADSTPTLRNSTMCSSPRATNGTAQAKMRRNRCSRCRRFSSSPLWDRTSCRSNRGTLPACDEGCPTSVAAAATAAP
mmetsp:Transcript_11408/g.35614  ORF Transcript_11408/g.35614 Transcript_11408/m.35614 type:complete len:282 (-) Transcript_11408:136-981(-)